MLYEAGIDFDKHRSNGIQHRAFAEYAFTSGSHLFNLGLLLNPETTWICFHGGFDFAYFMKTVSGDQYLPDFEDTFME
jgi:CCR4-NOT transcription complex subunit 7/8